MRGHELFKLANTAFDGKYFYYDQPLHGWKSTCGASKSDDDRSVNGLCRLAERAGFEPAIPCGIPDFESGAFDHSATSPQGGDYSRLTNVFVVFLCFSPIC